MTLVVDASALVAALAESRPEGRWAESAIAADDLAAPDFVLVEATSALRRLEVSGELSRSQADASRRDVLRVNLQLFRFAPFADRVWELRHNITSYDAAYVALAEWLGCPVVTLDRRLSLASGPRCEILTPPDA